MSGLRSAHVHRETSQEKAQDDMTTRTYATQANAPAGVTRARVADFGSCPAVSSLWSPIFGTTMATKHGRSRRTTVSTP
jgi:hypothetical protein